MGILQQASGTWTGTSFTATLPASSAATNGVILLVAADVTVSTPASWNLRTSQVNWMGHYLFDRVGVALTSVACTSGSGGGGTWWIAEIESGTYDGASGQNAITDATTYTTPSLTPTSGTREVIASIASLADNLNQVARTVSGWTNSFLEKADVCLSSGTSTYPMQGGAALDDLAANGSTAYSTGATYSSQSEGRSALILSYTTGPAVTRDPLPVSLAAEGSWDVPASSATVTPTYPADNNGELITATLAIKPDTSTVATPANWTAGPVADVGGGTQGAGTGACTGIMFTRVTDGSLSGGSQAFTITGGSSPVGVMHAWSYNATGYTDPQWEPVTATSYSRTTGSTTFGGTGAANLNLAAGDVLAFLSISADDQSTTHTISALAAAGCTLGAVTQSPSGTIINAQGNDISAAFAYAQVTAGTSSAAPTATVSGNTSETGGGIFYRIRATGILATGLTVDATDDAGSTDTAAVDQGIGVSDSVGSTDTAALTRGLDVTDSAGSTDTTTIIRTIGVEATDSAGSTDTASNAITLGVSATDSAGSTDTAALTRVNALTDNVGSVDTYSLTFGRGIAAEDVAGSLDTSAVALGRGLVVTDSAGSTDTATVVLGRNVTDSAGSTDTSSLTAVYQRPATDEAGSTDTSILTAAYVRQATDSAGSTDEATVTLLGAGQITATDSADSTDTSSLTAAYARPATDDTGSADVATVAVARGVFVTDAVGSADATALTRGLVATDSAGSTDSVSVSLIGAGQITATDQTGSTDSTTRTSSYQRPTTDLAGSTDDSVVSLTRRVVSTDVAGSTDTAAVALVRALGITDTAGSSDSATIVVTRTLVVTDTNENTDSAESLVEIRIVELDDSGVTDLAVITYIGEDFGTPVRNPGLILTVPETGLVLSIPDTELTILTPDWSLELT